MARTRRSDCNAPGITRRRRGRGFSYYWPDGSPVDDPQVVDRIKALAIPPAWTEVWICPWPNGHLQATGTDKAGRRQYRYHDAWRKQRDAEKFERIREFGKVLPTLRETVERDLRRKGLGKKRVLAAAVRLLDIGYFRIGGEEYAHDHDTYGVATLLKEHVKRQGGTLVFDYDAKGSKRRVIAIEDPLLVPVIDRLKRRRSGGDRLLAWRRNDGWVDATSNDVNDYIKRAAGSDFSAKDFRTWSATVLAAVGLAHQIEGQNDGNINGSARRSRSVSGRVKRAQVNNVVREVATAIGDTPAVCRSSYIDPAVVDRFEQGRTVAKTLGAVAAEPNGHLNGNAHEDLERAVLRLLAR